MALMRILGLITLITLIFWSIFWWNSAEKIKESVSSWFGQQIVGQERDYKKISIAGFPNRIDLSIENARYVNYQHQFSIITDAIQLLTLLYQRDIIISVIKPPVDIKYLNENFKLEGDPIKSSINFNSEKQFNKLVTKGSNLRIVSQRKNVWKLNDLLFAIEKEPNTETPKYRSHLKINNIVVPDEYLSFYYERDLVTPAIKRISFNGTISFAEDFYNLPSLNKVSQINNLMMEIDWGAIKTSLTGSIELSETKVINGSLTILISNWQKLLLILHKEKLINEKLFRKLKASLTFIASQVTNGDQYLSVPISIKDNLIFLGPIRIGKINSQIFM